MEEKNVQKKIVQKTKKNSLFSQALFSAWTYAIILFSMQFSIKTFYAFGSDKFNALSH